MLVFFYFDRRPHFPCATCQGSERALMCHLHPNHFLRFWRLAKNPEEKKKTKSDPPPPRSPDPRSARFSSQEALGAGGGLGVRAACAGAAAGGAEDAGPAGAGADRLGAGDPLLRRLRRPEPQRGPVAQGGVSGAQWRPVGPMTKGRQKTKESREKLWGRGGHFNVLLLYVLSMHLDGIRCSRLEPSLVGPSSGLDGTKCNLRITRVPKRCLLSQRLPIDLGPSNNLVLRPNQFSGCLLLPGRVFHKPKPIGASGFDKPIPRFQLRTAQSRAAHGSTRSRGRRRRCPRPPATWPATCNSRSARGGSCSIWRSPRAAPHGILRGGTRWRTGKSSAHRNKQKKGSRRSSRCCL